MTMHIFGKEIEVKKHILAIAAISAAVIAGGIGYAITGAGRDIIIEEKAVHNSDSGGLEDAAEKKTVEHGAYVDKKDKAEAGTVKKTGEAQVGKDEKDGSKGSEGDEQEEGKIESIKIYVVGCVRKPGIITLNRGQFIDDAIRAAGGLTSEADPDSINMVYELKENVMLHIQSKKEISLSKHEGEAGKGIRVVKDSGSAVVSGEGAGKNDGAAGAKAGPVSGRININDASAEELDKLPGVGAATARDIISYREANGPFKKPSDIMKIPRIKESRYNAIKDLITVE